jgi:hypothetical protein
MFSHINKNKTYVKQIQETLGITADGIAGPNTLKSLKEYYGSEVVSINGKFVPLNNKHNYIVEHDLSLYELADGTKPFYRRKTSPDTICMHWGGNNPRNLWMYFHNCKGSYKSTHFAIGRDPRDNNRVEIMQFVDTSLATWHAGKFNKYSVGIDISQPVEARHLKRAEQNGYQGVEVVENISSRGPSEMLSIDPEVAEVAKHFLQDLRVAMGLQHKPICKHEEVMGIDEAREFSLVSHLNLSKAKWDCNRTWAQHMWFAIDDDDLGNV